MALSNPFSSSLPVTDPNLFVGREELISEFSTSLLPSLFVGEAKAGKSSLLHRLKSELSNSLLRPGKTIPIYINLNSPSFKTSERVLSYIQSAIQRETNLEAREDRSRSRRPNAQHLLDLLLHLDLEGEHNSFVLLVDNIEQNAVFRRQNTELYSALRQLIEHSPHSNPVSVAATSTTAFFDPEASAVYSRLVSRLQVTYLSSLSPEDTQELLHRTRHVFPDDIDVSALSAHLFRETGGHPCLLQECLYRAVRDSPLHSTPARALKAATDSISTSGTSFFQQYLDQLSLEEITYLQALALDLPVDDWDLSELSIRRFASASLITADPDTPRGRATCRIFFRWLRLNAKKLIQVSRTFLSHVNDGLSVCDLLSRTLKLAVGNRAPTSERALQDIVQALLASHELSFVREGGPVTYKGKRFVPDFSLEALDLAIEIKLAKDTRRAGRLVDEILADIKAYKQRYGVLLFVVYDLTGRLAHHPFLSQEEDPGVNFVVVSHGVEKA